MIKCNRHRVGAVAAVVIALTCCLPSAGGEEQAGHGKIEAATPRYVSKNHDAWRSRGRIVGVAREGLPGGFVLHPQPLS